MAQGTINDMSRQELRAMIREVLIEVLSEFSDLADPDEGLNFRPEIADRLRAFQRDKPGGQSAADVARELSLDVYDE